MVLFLDKDKCNLHIQLFPFSACAAPSLCLTSYSCNPERLNPLVLLFFFPLISLVVCCFLYHCVYVEGMLIAFRKTVLLPTLVFKCCDIKLHHKVTWKECLRRKVCNVNTHRSKLDGICLSHFWPSIHLSVHPAVQFTSHNRLVLVFVCFHAHITV